MNKSHEQTNNLMERFFSFAHIIPQDVHVAFQGSAGSFSEVALRNFFGEEVHAQPYSDFSVACKALAAGENSFAALPIENTIVGTIHPSFDTIASYPNFVVIADDFLKIEHNLIGIEGTRVEDIKSVYSQTPGLDQCRDFLGKYPKWECVPFVDTAAAAEYVSKQQDKRKVAIASKRAAKIYNLNIIKANIESNRHNFTRFAFVVQKTHPYYALWQDFSREIKMQANVGILLFTSANTPGALLHCLSVFETHKINLQKIESRPIIGKPWEYRFTAEIELLENTPTALLKELSLVAHTVQVVGVYRREKQVII